MVNSTTPRFGPRWPPFRETASIRNSLISLASTVSSSGVSALTSRGLQIDSSMVIWCAPHVADAAVLGASGTLHDRRMGTPPESGLGRSRAMRPGTNSTSLFRARRGVRASHDGYVSTAIIGHLAIGHWSLA